MMVKFIVAVPENIDELPNEFWETYQQGEPFGLINIELSKQCWLS